MTAERLPLAGLRVLDYAQYVAGPLATMLLADLGADVIKVESPAGDAWRHYAPHLPSESSYFYSLNRNKRSVVLDLKTEEGLERSAALIATADAVVHNQPPERARQFRLDPESVHAVNPRAALAVVSAFGSTGPDSHRLGYDVIAQALSGLLMSDVRLGDEVPRRSGGIPLADITAGLLTATSVLAGLVQRADRGAPAIEVSLYGASLVMQLQRFVEIEPQFERTNTGISRAEMDSAAQDIARSEQLEPYYRCYETADGFVALACLNARQRRAVLGVFNLDDPWVENPQASPASYDERQRRATLACEFAGAFRKRSTEAWERTFASMAVPLGRVRDLSEVFDDDQANQNGLVQTVEQTGGPVRLLGNVFKCDGESAPAALPAPGLGEHTDEVFAGLPIASLSR